MITTRTRPPVCASLSDRRIETDARDYLCSSHESEPETKTLNRTEKNVSGSGSCELHRYSSAFASILRSESEAQLGSELPESQDASDDVIRSLVADVGVEMFCEKNGKIARPTTGWGS